MARYGEVLQGFTIDDVRGVAIAEFSIDDLVALQSAFGPNDGFSRDCQEAIEQLTKLKEDREAPARGGQRGAQG